MTERKTIEDIPDLLEHLSDLLITIHQDIRKERRSRRVQVVALSVVLLVFARMFVERGNATAARSQTSRCALRQAFHDDHQSTLQILGRQATSDAGRRFVSELAATYSAREIDLAHKLPATCPST